MEIRGLEKQDIPFIYSSWLKWFKDYSSFGQRLRHIVYYKRHHDVLNKIFQRKPIVRVATPKNDKSVIVGYLVMEGAPEKPVVHFCYVKGAFKGMGIANKLIEGLNLKDLIFTHWTHDCDWIYDRLPFAIYDPYLL